MTKDEALKLALDLAIMHHSDGGYAELRLKVRQLAKEALAQPEQEPCGGCGGSGWVPRDPDIGTDQECFNCNGSGTQPNEPEQEPVAWEVGVVNGVVTRRLASPASPPKRPWVGLTEVEGTECWSPSAVKTWQAIEAKLKEKNFD